MIRHLDLFAGIGGFALAIDNKLSCYHDFVEYENHLQRVLCGHWEDSKIFGDIRSLHPDKEYEIYTGGFPCQDISRANTNKKKGGINGERSGLWSEYKRVLKEG